MSVQHGFFHFILFLSSEAHHTTDTSLTGVLQKISIVYPTCILVIFIVLWNKCFKGWYINKVYYDLAAILEIWHQNETANRKSLCMTLLLPESAYLGFQLWCFWSYQPLLWALLFISIQQLSTTQFSRALLSWCAHPAPWQPAAKAGEKNKHTPWNFTRKLLNIPLSHKLYLHAQRWASQACNGCICQHRQWVEDLIQFIFW